MKFRTGLIIGAAIGYYFGAKAGREQYELMEDWLDKIRGTAAYRDLSSKVSDGLRDTTTAAKRLIEDTAYRVADDHRGRIDHDITDEYDITDEMDLRPLFSDPTLN